MAIRDCFRNIFHIGIDTKQYEYPCNFAKSKETSDITVPINHQPDRNFLLIGEYNFNLVPCTCPRPTILQRIRSLFNREIQEQERISKEPRANCQFHNNDFDILFQSNLPIHFFQCK